MTQRFFEKSDWPYYALGIQIRKHEFLSANENFRERANLDLMIIMGVLGVSLWKMKKI